MRITSILAFILAIAVLIIGLRWASDDLRMFLNYPSLFIVFGGTFAATAVSFQLERILLLLKVFSAHIRGTAHVDYEALMSKIVKIAESYRKGEDLNRYKGIKTDYFLNDAIELISEGIVGKDQIVKILEDRAENLNFHYNQDANKIKTIGKFPPAFGMMGTTIGMIVLLSNLGGDNAIKMIGPAMGICLITTLYGVAFANLVVIPVGENLAEISKNNYLKNLLVIEGVRQVFNKSNPIVLVEELNSFLRPSDRVDYKKLVG